MKPYMIRQAWAMRYGLTPKQAHDMSDKLMCQLSCCLSDHARELILGIVNKV